MIGGIGVAELFIVFVVFLLVIGFPLGFWWMSRKPKYDGNEPVGVPRCPNCKNELKFAASPCEFCNRQW